ncbi:hypothetical protein ACQBAR_06515 [Propionibacteriaceae bacterium Y1685]
MDHCPNCGAAVAPTAMACPACRMPRPRGLSQSGSGVGPHGLFRPDQPEGPVGAGDADDETHRPTRSNPFGHHGDDPDATPAGPWPTTAAGPDQERTRQQPSAPSSAAWVTEPIRGDSAPPPPLPPRPAPTPAGPSPFADLAQNERRRQRRTVVGIVTGALLLALLLGVGVALAINSAGGREAQPTVPSDEPVPPPASGTHSVPPPTAGPSDSVPPSSANPTDSAPTDPASTNSGPPTNSPSKSPEPKALPKDSTSCEQGRIAVPKKGTSCAFAREVAKQVAGADSQARSFSVRARSPVTKKDYTMDCTRDGALVTCTGGTGAVVYVLEEQ